MKRDKTPQIGKQKGIIKSLFFRQLVGSYPPSGGQWNEHENPIK
jgi:hypothetical protein